MNDTNIILIAFGVNVLIGALLGSIKGRALVGILGAVLLGPIGWILVLVWRDERLKCPACKGVVPKDASKCMHCGGPLGSAPANAQRAPAQVAPRRNTRDKMPDSL